MNKITKNGTRLQNKGKDQDLEINPKAHHYYSTAVKDLSREVNNLSKVLWDYQIVHHVYQIHQKRETSP